MQIGPRHLFAVGAALVLIVVLLAFFRETKFFFFLFGIAVLIAALPFFADFLLELGREKEKEEMFLDFTRDLSEGVASGIPISKSIINLIDKDYGDLTPHVRKLASQISLGTPFKKALHTFAADTRNKLIERSVTIIIEAEESGGEIGSTLDSVAKSVAEIEDLKKERKAIIYNQVVQGYIIFLIFIIIMLILQLWLLPKIQEVMQLSDVSQDVIVANTKFLNNSLLFLIILQSFFTGLVVGQLSEGRIRHGLKHSVILIILAYLIITAAHAFKPALPV